MIRHFTVPGHAYYGGTSVRQDITLVLSDKPTKEGETFAMSLPPPAARMIYFDVTPAELVEKFQRFMTASSSEGA